MLDLGTFLHMLFETVPESVTYGYKMLVSSMKTLCRELTVKTLENETVQSTADHIDP